MSNRAVGYNRSTQTPLLHKLFCVQFPMSDTVITVENLSKSYLVGHNQGRYGETFRETVGRQARNVVRNAVNLVRGRQIVVGDQVEEFWALKDVSFEVRSGEVLGIIGRNGAGKSTLLKILSRITDPTEGRIQLRGRVASLLEVGTGFHAELTGVENIFLNGAILGMTRREILKKFDEIVAFAGVEKFLDTPVKRYSSGMYVRLAFAVAAHLEPEILVVDEVLAVGDTEFQRKCLGKMDEISRQEGRTVLFVSHNLGAVAEMADRALLLDSGCVAVDGAVSEAISTYLSKGSREASYVRPFAQGGTSPRIARVEVLTSENNGMQHFGKPLEVRFWIEHPQPVARAYLSFQIVNQFQQQPVVHAFDHELMFGSDSGSSSLLCRFPELRLNVGQFYLRVFLTGPPGTEEYDTLDGICHFEVVRSDRNVLWGWRREACAYHEQYTWKVTDAKAKLES
jgi:ABC-type polysaccharide/polyol phosphate transport system ATPase subunit